jgi:hypothetical protein
MIRLPLLLERELWFIHSHRRLGHFRRPTTFSEKLNWRILHDRRPLLAWTCDKLRMKEEAARYGVPSPRTYWSGADLTTLVNVALPEAWVLKPNHRSGLVYFGRGPVTEYDVAKLQAVTHGWLDDAQGRLYREWAYVQARSCLLVEEMLGDQPLAPPDYKFFMFDGQPHLISVTTERRRKHGMRFYVPPWEPVQCSCGYPVGPLEEPPDRLDQMLDIAARLAQPFDFIRIDLYDVGETIYLGEYTPYPNGGMRPYRPFIVERELGAAWQLPSLV